ncbi:MAG: glycosyltransferase family 4 protein [Candidatus Moraniibacteriota bacterium]|nr:MAG: glycosyltransferase family 4 protein [Candidatus Moranbacteria bacterium]
MKESDSLFWGRDSGGWGLLSLFYLGTKRFPIRIRFLLFGEEYGISENDMKIGIDARFYGPLGKGLGRYTAELIQSLEAIDSKNEYVIFLRQENFHEYIPKNPRFRKVIADFSWYSFEEQIFFPWLLWREACDVVHFPHFNVPLLYRRPFVVTVHDLILLRFPTLRSTTLSPFFYRLKFYAYRIVIRSALLRAKRVITVSNYTKRDILDRYEVSPERISVTYEAAHPFCFLLSPEREQALFSRLDLLSSPSNTNSHDILRPYALYVGNAYPHKNLESLLQAFANFPDREVRLILVGRDDYFYKRLKRFAKERNLSSVIFAGFVPDDELDSLYKRARLSVFPSRYEGFGLPPLEAMMKGSPVLAARAAAFPEILGSAALFFDPEQKSDLRSALETLWEDESLRHSLRHDGFRRAAEFSWERMGRETLPIYESAVSISREPLGESGHSD